jgi:histidine triad (HIT) family protein
MECLFCEIAAGRIPSRKVYEDATVLLFHDINPKAPVHILAVPKRHVTSLATVTAADWPDVSAALQALVRVAGDLGLADNGYRIVANTGRHGGQTVPHLHWHLLGGRDFGWPPG